MEDNLTNQEEQFRDLAENFSLEIDTNELWNNVEARLPSQKKRRKPIIWWFVAGIMIPLFAIVVWINFPTSNSTLLQLNTLNPSPEKTESLESSDEIKKHTKETPFQDIVKEPITAKTIMNSNVVKESRPIQKTEKSSPVQKKNTLINEYTRYDEKSTSQKEVISQSPVTEESIVTTLVDPSVSTGETITIEEIREEREILVFIRAKILSPLEIKSENNLDLNLGPKEIKPFKVTQWKPYFAFSSGMNLSNSNIYSLSDENLNLDQFQSEKSLPGFSSVVRFGCENNSGWRYGVGLEYNRMVNRFIQKETVETTKDINGIESSSIDDDGKVISTEGLISETTITEYDFQWHRNHDFVNVQLSIGKRIIQSGRFALFADANISKNIWSQHSGYYFRENEVLISRFEQGQNHPYTNAGFGLGSSLSFEYRLDMFSISISPFASKGLNSIMQKTNYYQIKNSHYGIQLGIVYRP